MVMVGVRLVLPGGGVIVLGGLCVIHAYEM